MPATAIETNPPIAWGQHGLANNLKQVLAHAFRNDDDWWLAAVRSRAERAFAHALIAEDADASYFLPMIKAAKGNKSETGMRMLFPGYMFMWMKHPSNLPLACRRHLVQTLPVKFSQVLCGELLSIDIALGNDSLRPVSEFVTGHRVRIVSGPLMGIEGFVNRLDADAQRLYLNVTMLGRGAEIDIDMGVVEVM